MSTEFGKTLRRLRTRTDDPSFTPLNQAELAAATGLHYSAISRMENGDFNPTDDTVKALARALHVDPRTLWSARGVTLQTRWEPPVASAADRLQEMRPFWRNLILHLLNTIIDWTNDADSRLSTTLPADSLPFRLDPEAAMLERVLNRLAAQNNHVCDDCREVLTDIFTEMRNEDNIDAASALIATPQTSASVNNKGTD